MAMQEYALVDSGFLVDSEVSAHIVLAAEKAANLVPEVIQGYLNDGTFTLRAKTGELPADYFDVMLACDVITGLLGDSAPIFRTSSFSGTATSLLPEHTNSPLKEQFSDDVIGFIQTQRESSLFKAAYSSPEELLEEFKTAMQTANVPLPDDFDWWTHIVKITGTIFC